MDKYWKDEVRRKMGLRDWHLRLTQEEADELREWFIEYQAQLKEVASFLTSKP